MSVYNLAKHLPSHTIAEKANEDKRLQAEAICIENKAYEHLIDTASCAEYTRWCVVRQFEMGYTDLLFTKSSLNVYKPCRCLTDEGLDVLVADVSDTKSGVVATKVNKIYMGGAGGLRRKMSPAIRVVISKQNLQ